MVNLRSVIVFIGCVSLALISAVQAASNVLAKRYPVAVFAILPSAPKAANQLAETAQLSGQIGDPSKYARHAYAVDPLSGKAIAVLGSRISDRDSQQQFFDTASKMSQRGTFFQGTLLAHYAGRSDTAGTLRTLDQVLTVYPDLRKSVMPSFLEPLKKPNALGIYKDILLFAPEWRDDFLIAAAKNPTTLTEVTELRFSLGGEVSVGSRADMALMQQLVRAERYTEAYDLYNFLTDSSGSMSRNSGDHLTLDWRTQFAPFDWKLTDEPNSFARANSDSSELQLYVSRGYGAVLAQRLIVWPKRASSVIIAHDLQSSGLASGVEVEVKCAISGEVLVTSTIFENSDRFELGLKAGTCGVYELVISARAWSSEGDISGAIRSIELVSS